MTTAIQLITNAMRLKGALGKSETPDADDASEGLTTLNLMLDSWSLERMFVPYILQEALTLAAGTTTYTMGTSGNLNTTRPTQIDDSCFVTVNSMDFPLKLIDADQYASIVNKAAQSNIPIYLFADYQYPLVRLSFFPTPSDSGTAYIRSWKQLQQFATLTDAMSLPQGNEAAITYSLAELVNPELPLPVSVEVMAMKSRRNLKRINAPDSIMSSEVGYMNQRSASNIRAG